MTTQEILANATPRPWVPSETEGDIETGDSRELCATAYDMKNRTIEGDANRDLILLAVNTYEEREALIGQLVAAAGNIACTSCEHPLRLHLDLVHGCEQEVGDAGPCGCVGGSKAEDALIDALATAKQREQGVSK